MRRGQKIPVALATLLLATGLYGAETPRKSTEIREPHYGEVLFHFYKDDYFRALVRLMAADERGLIARHGSEARLLRGGLLLSYGQHEEAALIFEQLLAANPDPETRDRTWFFLAKIRFQRGYVRQADFALSQIGNSLPGELRGEYLLLGAQIKMHQERHSEAAALLETWRGSEHWTAYARYNLGVALVRSGHRAEGGTLLDRLGSMEARTEELASLRDKANVALGYSYLQEETPAAARPVLERVRLDGPFSNKALLGIGWADSALGNYRRALVPWTELYGRNLLDAAVQESLLAVPYALGKLQANAQAAERYLAAIDAFADESARIDQAIGRIQAGEMVNVLLDADVGEQMGWYWRLDELPDSTENRYLHHLLAGHEFQEALKNYRDVLFLQRNLTEWRESIGVFRHMLETRKLAYSSRLPQVERALADGGLEETDAVRLELEARLNRIIRERDVLGLATSREQRLWREVERLAASPALQAGLPEAEDAASKIRLVRGVLAWNLDKNFKARAWRQQKNLRDLERALAEGRRARQNVASAMVEGPESFASFDHRIESLLPRIDSLLARLAVVAEQQRGYLRRISERELEAQKDRLATYSVQARFALASAYDRAAQLREDP